MMEKICFATNNLNKLREIQQMLNGIYQVVSLEELGCHVELPENQETLEGNSLEKAEFVYKNFDVAVFADDTGLEVNALEGNPGVYSARYASLQRDSLDNMNKLLSELEGSEDRTARFRTVVTLIKDDKTDQFEGIVDGKIATAIVGKEGFGYDPIFIPEEHSITFAEMALSEKNQISHRKRAIEKLVEFLVKKSEIK
jgi:XTP/dITP diphosphohydrolase